MVHISIDRDECILCAACWEAFPEVLEESEDDGMSQILPKFRIDEDPARGQVPEELRDCVIEAADACPVQIIHLRTT
jgi:ferredoxin